MADNDTKTATSEKKGTRPLHVALAVLAVLLAIAAPIAVHELSIFEMGKRPSAEETLFLASDGALITFDTFVVNLADPGGDRYLKATLRAVSSDETLPTQIARDRVLHSRIRDKIITVLTAKRFDDVSSPIGKETLRREIAHEVNKVLAREAVEEILFVEFVVQ